ncbi:MAG: chromosome segregation protein SMC [Firmicutes bacterium]|nr:chromosome segregation protein SMC [Bacillota bacterium]
MELKRVEIVGFKSFPEKVQVKFGEGVTAIVGPNGSGKSNISDAVRWVLGEQSAKQLRGSKMEDVIFAGTERRKPLGFAEVCLVLDNSDHKMHVSYDEVAISRRIFRSGESEYAINGGKCRLRDVQEILMDTGIGKDGYSLIGQGQIDQLLSTKPQDRRAIFEEASGITKYKTRREQASKQLEDESARLERVSDILGELESRVAPLEKQAETAKIYLELKEQLKLYEVSSFIGEYEQLKDTFDKVSASLASLEEQISASRLQEEQAREKSESLASSVSENRKKLQTLNQTLGELKVKLETLEGDKRVLQEQEKRYGQESASLKIRIRDLKDKISDRSRTLEKEEAKLSSLEEKQKALSFQVQETKKQIDQAAADEAQSREKVRQLSKNAVQAEEEVQFAQQEKQRFSLLLSSDNQMLLNRQSEIDELSQRQKDLSGQIEDRNRQLEEAREELKAQEEALQEASDDLKQVQERIQNQTREQESLVLKMKDMQGRINWLKGLSEGYEGYSASVKSLMKLKAAYSKGQSGPQARLGSAIHGTLADLIHVPSKLTVAIDVALGAGLQNIVVDNTQGAKGLIEYLRQGHIGRATFLPLDSVKARSRVNGEDAIKRMEGVIGFADELIETKDIYKGILSRTLGNVVVAADFDSASRVSKAYGNAVRVVTLSGDLFNIGGSITGGSLNAQKSGILSRKAEEEELSSNLQLVRRQGDELYRKIRLSSQEKEQKAALIAPLSEKLHALREEIHSMEGQILAAQAQLGEVNSRADALNGTSQEDSQLKKTHQEGLEKSLKRLSDAQEASLEARSLLEKAEAEHSALEEKLQEQKDLLSARNMELGSAAQEKQFMQQQKDWEIQEIDNLTHEAEALMDQVLTSDSSEKEAKEQMLRLDEEMEEARARTQQMQEEAHTWESLYEETNQAREEALKKTEELLRSFNLLEKEQVRLENQQQRAKKDLDDLQDRMWEEYQITYGAAKDLAREGFPDDPEMQAASELSKTKRRQQISQLKSKIRDLGPVNVEAITELKALMERCTFLRTQKEDIENSERDLQEVIRQMTIKMEKQFQEGFKTIAASFDKVFKQMFGGGQGILRLTEEEDSLQAGIEIIAQPPGKKLQSMMLLSGGERALTAIALLFAIQQLNPTPFCILDEIEAALDDANVERYADYLKAMSDHTQFIVITHRKGTMVAADTLYGVTMEEKGVSKCISVNFESDLQEEKYGAV